mmetsp:Transcript_6468/g.13799  ORF Transcript_6468/g.13799 Transcript_6468/m.13799 type:complete len:216 (-) Transcript_6468:128-775(-)
MAEAMAVELAIVDVPETVRQEYRHGRAAVDAGCHGDVPRRARRDGLYARRDENVRAPAPFFDGVHRALALVRVGTVSGRVRLRRGCQGPFRNLHVGARLLRRDLLGLLCASSAGVDSKQNVGGLEPARRVQEALADAARGSRGARALVRAEGRDPRLRAHRPCGGLDPAAGGLAEAGVRPAAGARLDRRLIDHRVDAAVGPTLMPRLMSGLQGPL